MADTSLFQEWYENHQDLPFEEALFEFLVQTEV